MRRVDSIAADPEIRANWQTKAVLRRISLKSSRAIPASPQNLTQTTKMPAFFLPLATHSRHRSMRAIGLALLLVCCCVSSAEAQLQGTLADRPMGVGYMRDITQVRVLEYTTKLAKRLEIGKMYSELVTAPPELKELDAKVETPITGAAWYLVQGLIPSFETIYFQQVADLADAKRVLEARKKMMGTNGNIEAQANNCFKFHNSNSWTTAVPDGQTAEEYVQQVNSQNYGGSAKMSAKVVEADGKKQVEQTWTMTEYYRFHDNMLFSSGFEDLWGMDLPTAETFTSGVSNADDMGMELFFDRIPMGIKQLGWGMLSGAAGVQMQQRDDEEQSIADLRKRSIQFGLDLVKAVMFDVGEANGWLKFATDDEMSIRGELNFATRRNSELTKRLEDVSSGNSRFAAILRDEAPATLHLCVKIFEESDPMLDALGKFFVQAVSQDLSGDAEIVNASSEIARTLNGIGEHRTLEFILKAGWTEQSDGVIYGGLQVDNNPNLLRSLFTLATKSPNAPENVFELIEKDGQEVIQFTLPESDVVETEKRTSLKLTHVFVTHQHSCLWIAAGGENAYEILRASMDRSANSGLAARAPLFTGKIDFDRWLQLPEDDPVGVSQLLTWLDANVAAFPPSPMSFAVLGAGQEQSKPTPLLERIFDLGGERQMGFSVMADQSGLRASLKIGEAIGNYYLARMIDAQDRMFSQQREAATEAANAEVVEEVVTPPVKVVE